MPTLAANQIRKIMGDGQTDGVAFFTISNCNTNDQVDLTPWFLNAKLAIVLWTTTAKSDKLAVPVANQVILSTNGLAGDAGWLVVWGSVIPGV